MGIWACSPEVEVVKGVFLFVQFSTGQAGTRLPRWLWQDSRMVDAMVME